MVNNAISNQFREEISSQKDEAVIEEKKKQFDFDDLISDALSLDFGPVPHHNKYNNDNPFIPNPDPSDVQQESASQNQLKDEELALE